MESSRKLECLVELCEGRTRLLAPEVGLYVHAPSVGAVLAAGQVLGRIVRLGVTFELVVPEAVLGVVVSESPVRLRQPVGYGELLVELKPISATGSGVTASAGAAAANELLVVKAPSSGRFWHRPAPGEATYAQTGQRLAEGAALGLLEVMKTFSHINYKSGGVLPPNARFVRYACADGAEVKAGAPLVVVEP